MNNFENKFKQQHALVASTMPDEYQVEISKEFIKFHDKNGCALMTLEDGKNTCYICMSAIDGALFGINIPNAMTHVKMCLNRYRQLLGRYCTLCGTHWLEQKTTLHSMTEEHVNSIGHQQQMQKAAQHKIFMLEERAATDQHVRLRRKAENFICGGVISAEDLVPFIKAAINIVTAFPKLDDVQTDLYVGLIYEIFGIIGCPEIAIIMKALERHEQLGAKVFEEFCVPAPGGKDFASSETRRE